jgi:Domain of unknown function (DUF4340)
MSRERFITLVVVALVAISGALYFSTQRNQPHDAQGLALLPSLAGELDTVTALNVRKGSTAAVTIQKQGEQWTVAERANYPADVAKVHKLVLALSEAKIREEKTSDPANYAAIGVEDVSQPDATGAQIELTAKDGKHAVIVGKSAGQGSFIRRAGEKASYSVEPAISFEAEPRYWIDTRLLDIPADKIQSIEYKPAGSPAYALRRVPAAPAAATPSAAPGTPGVAPSAPASAPAATPAAPAPVKFALEGAPSGRQAADPQSLVPSPTTLSSLAAEDVAPVADIDFSKPSVAAITLSDGGTLTVTGASVGDKRWIQVAAPKDAALNAKAAGRAFEIASYRYDLIFKPLEQMLVPKPTPPAKPAAPGAKKPAPAPTP